MVQFMFNAPNSSQGAISLKDASDYGYLEREILFPLRINETQEEAPFNALLDCFARSMGTKTCKSHMPQWAVGDGYKLETTLLNPVTLAATTKGTACTLTFATPTSTVPQVPEDEVVHLYSTSGYHAIIHYRSGSGASRVVYASQSASAWTVAATTVYMLGTAAMYNAQSPNGTVLGASYLTNATQRFREAVQIAPDTVANANYVDLEMNNQVINKMKAMRRKMERAYFMNNVPAVADSNWTDSSIMGGIDYFLRGHLSGNTGMPDYLGSTMSDMKGKVYLESGSSISKRRLRTIMNELSTWGNTDKRILICTPSVGEIFLDMADAEGCLVSNSQYVIPGELGILMAAPEIIKTGFGSLFIVIDRSMEGYNKTIYSGTNYIAGDDWGYIIDPSVWYKIYHERPADDPTPGIQTLKTREVKVTENGNEIKKYEIMEQSTLACKEPRANATIAFGTIV